MQAVKGLRLFSSAPRPFVQDRIRYGDKLKDLRKVWHNEISVAQEREEQKRQAEKKRIVLEKAISLRQQRADAAIRQEKARQAREAALQRYREKLAHNCMMQQQEEKKQLIRVAKFAEDLEHEKSTWLNSTNMTSRITDNLFAKPSTTGLVTHESELWRWNVLTIKLDRPPMSAEASPDFTNNTTLANRLVMRGHARSAHRIVVEHILDPMIGTGSDREKYKEYVAQFTKHLAMGDAFDEGDQGFDTAMNEKDSEVYEFPAEHSYRRRNQGRGGDDNVEPDVLAAANAIKDDEPEETVTAAAKGKKGAKGAKNVKKKKA